jgi:ATP-dependent DNA ligase
MATRKSRPTESPAQAAGHASQPDAANFPVAPPIEPMLAKLADVLPAAGAFMFEPKWDGFRAIVFRGKAGDVFIQSRDLRPFDR